MDCRVVVEAAVPVYDVETADEAVRIAISKTGEMLNPDLNYVEIEMGSRQSPGGEELPPAFIAADEALVALELRMDVYNVDREEHASRIARKEIGQRLRNIPLKVLRVTPIDENGKEVSTGEDDSAESPADGGDNAESPADRGDSEESSAGDEDAVDGESSGRSTE